MEIINNYISQITLGTPVNSGDLTVYPVFSNDHNQEDILLLEVEEAVSEGLAEVTEVTEGGHVPELLVHNKSECDVIIFDGEELAGAKQNRIVNLTIIVPALTRLIIPVSCVEQGRWQYRSRKFRATSSFAYPSMRSRKFDKVKRNVRERRSFASDQGEIWDDIEEKSVRLRVSSPTMAMEDVLFSALEKADDKPLEIKHQENQIGYLAFIRGGFAGGDVFGSAAHCERKLKRLVESYYFDSLDGQTEFVEISAEDVLSQIQNTKHDKSETVGKGEDYRFETDSLQGVWKFTDGQIPHLLVLPNAKNN